MPLVGLAATQLSGRRAKAQGVLLLHESLYGALRMSLIIIFFAYPIVTDLAFQSWICDDFKDESGTTSLLDDEFQKWTALLRCAAADDARRAATAAGGDDDDIDAAARVVDGVALSRSEIGEAQIAAGLALVGGPQHRRGHAPLHPRERVAVQQRALRAGEGWR